ncbi:MAG: hypothetical protein F4018_12630 [Acidobacteria bacterium]|nr:hypothetical protein [Acidobacteriota bacterium]MYK89103.1 hypothetical protein [Acidobacteriota bacterium]
MTRAEFTAAAAENRQLRLLNRSRAFYIDEWYDPIVNDDGILALDAHTGETIEVSNGLLAQLTDEPAILTVGKLRDRLGRYPDDNPAVLPSRKDSHGGIAHGDITAESIEQVLLRPGTGAHPHDARYVEAGFADRHAPDAFEAVRIGHAAH